MYGTLRKFQSSSTSPTVESVKCLYQELAEPLQKIKISFPRSSDLLFLDFKKFGTPNN